MILIDFSSILHRKIFTSITSMKPKKEDGKYITGDFIDYTKHLILEELFDIVRVFGPRFGDLVICLDNKSPEGYWRKDVLKTYKAKRSKNRQESDIDFQSVWPHLNALTEAIKLLPWKCVEVHRAEADDIILVLADEFTKFNPALDYTKTEVLIHSPDKDMIQAQFGTDSVLQYSALTNKWIIPETKSADMEDWLLEHICLGDVSDEVPKIVDWTEFSDNFKKYLTDNNISAQNPFEFKKLPKDTKLKLLQGFDIMKTNRAGEELEKDVYKDMRFGATTLNKAIEKFGSLDGFLDSHPMYREHYERNKTLVLTEGIPDYIRDSIIENYENAPTEYYHHEFEEYLRDNNLSGLIMEIPQSVTSARGELTADDW